MRSRSCRSRSRTSSPFDDFFVKVFPNLMAHATPQKERATAIHFLMKELNRLEDDDIEDVMLRDGVIHFVKPPTLRISRLSERGSLDSLCPRVTLLR